MKYLCFFSEKLQILLIWIYELNKYMILYIEVFLEEKFLFFFLGKIFKYLIIFELEIQLN